MKCYTSVHYSQGKGPDKVTDKDKGCPAGFSKQDRDNMLISTAQNIAILEGLVRDQERIQSDHVEQAKLTHVLSEDIKKNTIDVASAHEKIANLEKERDDRKSAKSKLTLGALGTIIAAGIMYIIGLFGGGDNSSDSVKGK